MAGSTVKDFMVRVLVDDSQTKKVDDLAKTGMPKLAAAFGTGLSGALTKVGSQLDGEVGEVVSKLSQGVDSFMEGSGIAGKVGAVAGVAAGVGGALTAMGSGAKQADDQLDNAFKNAGASTDDYKDKIEDTVNQQAKYGTSAEETKQALASLTEKLGDPQKALDAMGTAADYAAAKHISLTSASTKLGSALAGGSTRAFTEFGITVQKNSDGTKDLGGAFDQLSQKVNGQASASVDNWVGKLKGAKTEVQNWVTDAGEKFGPAITAVSSTLAVMAGIVEAVSAARAAHSVVEGIESAATDVDTEATLANNAAWYANPVTWIIAGIIAAIALLVGATILIIKNWGPISAWFGKLWTGIKVMTGEAIDWIGDKIGSIGDFFGTVGTDIGKAVTFVGDGAKKVALGAATAVAWLWNHSVGAISFTVPSWVPGIGGKKFSEPQITVPKLASGGIATQATLALIGEAGPEAVVPLSQGDRYGLGGGSGDQTIVLNLDGKSFMTWLRRTQARQAF